VANFYRDCHQKELKKRRGKVESRTLIQTADRPEIDLKVACDITESVDFGKM